MMVLVFFSPPIRDENTPFPKGPSGLSGPHEDNGSSTPLDPMQAQRNTDVHNH